MKGIFVLVLITSTFSMTIHGKTLELTKSARSIFIEDKKEWTLGKDLFGMPFVYFAPLKNGQRSNISFTDTGAELELDVRSLKSSQEVYREGKKKWAAQLGAKVLGFEPYEVWANKHGHQVHSIGLDFEHEGKTYRERSFYIECRGKVIFSKGLRPSNNSEHDKDFKDLINTLDCGGA